LKDGGGGVITGMTFFAGSTTVNSGATLDFNDSFNQAIRNLNGGGNVRMGDAAGNNLTLFVDGGTTQTFSGSISGAHGSVLIEITGGPPGPTGTMILTGAAPMAAAPPSAPAQRCSSATPATPAASSATSPCSANSTSSMPTPAASPRSPTTARGLASSRARRRSATRPLPAP
jgi:hypothetical protein